MTELTERANDSPSTRAGVLAVLSAVLLGVAPGLAVVTVNPGESLQTAINGIADGGVIELTAGTHTAPATSIQISNVNKQFTIRAADGATVEITGGGPDGLVESFNSNTSLAGHVVFQDILFAGGMASNVNRAGAVTLSQGVMTFVRCRFVGNSSTGDNAGGAVFGFSDSSLRVIDSRFEDNTYLGNGAALRISAGDLVVQGTYFLNNRSDIAGHNPGASGAGIHAFDSTVTVSNSRFEGNHAGWLGGGIYGLGTFNAPFTTPITDILVVNSTFVDNLAKPFPGVMTPSATEGGQIHVEAQTRLRVYNSRFTGGEAEVGGAISSYRSAVEVEGSVFRNNVATSTSGSQARGGAINLGSADGAGDPDNYPSASLILRDSLIEGDGADGTMARVGGGIFASGDANRQFGIGAVPQDGTHEQNRIDVLIERVVFHDLDVDHASGIVRGGAINVSYANAQIVDSLFLGCDARGVAGGWGGALSSLGLSVIDITGTTFARNTAVAQGGALHALGSQLDVASSFFHLNEVSPGVSESVNSSHGAAITSGPEYNHLGVGTLDFDASGLIQGNVFQNQVGLAIFELDSDEVPINLSTYEANQFAENSFSDDVFRNTNASPARNPAELNALVVSRASASDTDKAPADDNSAEAVAKLAAVLGVPPAVLTPAAADDPEAATASFVGWAADGGSSTLNGSPVSSHGVLEVGTGIHTLSVDGAEALAEITDGPDASATFVASPIAINGGSSSDLEWALSTGSFLGAFLDPDVGTGGTASGFETVMPPEARTYHLVMVGKEGGLALEATVYVDEDPPEFIFVDGFESGDTSQW